jgi:hypothetical protein
MESRDAIVTRAVWLSLKRSVGDPAKSDVRVWLKELRESEPMRSTGASELLQAQKGKR